MLTLADMGEGGLSGMLTSAICSAKSSKNVRFKFQIFIFLKHVKFSVYSIALMNCLSYYLFCAIKLYPHENCLLMCFKMRHMFGRRVEYQKC